jgi:hypothetical protein
VGGGGSAPKAPAFKPIDAKVVGDAAKAQDIQGYQMSDADYAKRFPQLVKGRQANIDSAIQNVSGGADKQTASALGSAGLSRNLGSTEFQKGRSLGQPILQLEQRDQGYFSRMLGENPQRTAGLSGKNIGEIAASNATGQNAYAQGIYGSNVNMYNQQIAQAAQNTSAGIGAFGSLFGAGIKAFGSPPPNSGGFLSPYSYGPTTPAGYQGGPAWGSAPAYSSPYGG